MNTDTLALGAAVGLAAAALAGIAMVTGAGILADYRARFTRDARFRLGELFLFVDPARLFALNLAVLITVGVGLGLVSGQPALGVGGACAAAMLPHCILLWLRQRRLRQIEAQLADALQILAGALRAGIALPGAMQQLVREGRPPLAQEFDLLLREHRLGVRLDTALEHLAERVPLQAMTLVVAAMRVAIETGGGLAEALERVAITVRSQLAIEGKVRALTAQGKLQAIVVGLLPLALMLVLSRMEAEAMAQLWTTQTGWATLAVIALLEFFGVLLIRRIVAIDI